RDFHVTGVQTCALPIYPGIGQEAFGSQRRDKRTAIEQVEQLAEYDGIDGNCASGRLPRASVLHELEQADARAAKQRTNEYCAEQIGRASCRETQWSTGM